MNTFSKVLTLYRILDLAWVYFILNTLWRLRPESMYTTVQHFSEIEADTSKQLYWVYNFCQSKQAQRILLNQILDEINHVHIFKKITSKNGNNSFFYSPEQKRLYPAREDAKYLIIYCHVGETEAATRLRNILACTRNQDLRRAIESVLSDEQGHVIATKKALLLVAPDYNMNLFDRDCLRIFVERRLGILKRLLQNLLLIFVKILLVAIYYTFGLFLFPFCRKRMLNHQELPHSLEINRI